MKTKNEANITAVRNKYTTQFKKQALDRADRDGIPKVAQDLGLAESMLYSWRAKRRQTGQPFEEQKLQQAEMARLKRENARLEEEMAFLKKAAAYPSTSSGHALQSCPSEVRHDQDQRKSISNWHDVSPIIGFTQWLLPMETETDFG